MSTIDLLRHGEPEGGLRYRGDGIDDRAEEACLAALEIEPGWAEAHRSLAQVLRRAGFEDRQFTFHNDRSLAGGRLGPSRLDGTHRLAPDSALGLRGRS